MNHLVGVVTITWKFVWNNLLADLVWSPRRQILIMTPSMLSLVQTKASIVEEETHWYGVSLRGRYARVSQSKAIKHKYIGLSYKSWEFLHHCFSEWIILLLTLLRNNSSFLSYECSFFFLSGLEIVDKYRAPSRPAKNIEGLENLTDCSWWLTILVDNFPSQYQCTFCWGNYHIIIHEAVKVR